MSATKKTKVRSRQRRLFRALVVVALLVVISMLAAWAWIESRSGQETVRLWLEDRGTELLGRAVRIGSLELDLVPFDAFLNEVQIDGGAGSDELLFRAASMRLRLGPWALLSRQLLIRSLEIESPVVHWDIPTDPRSLNLSPTGDNTLSVAVDSLSIEGGTLELNHQLWNLDTSLTGLSLGVQPAARLPVASRTRSGFLSIDGGAVSLAPGTAGAAATGGSLDVGEADISFTLDDNLIRIESGRLAVGASELSANGTVTNWSEGDFAVAARLQITDLVALAGLDIDGARGGEASLDGNLTFGAEPLSFAARLSAPTITIAGVGATDLSAEISATRERLLVDALQASLFSGSVTARIEADLGSSPRAWLVDYEASGINLASLTTAPGLAGFRFAGSGAGRGNFAWQGLPADTITGSGSFEIALPPGTLERLTADSGRATTATGDAVGAAPVPTAPAATQGRGRQTAAPSLPVPIEARIDFELDRGSLIVRNATASLPRTEASVQGSIGRDRAISGNVRVESGDLRTLDQLFTQVRRFRGELPVPQPFGIAGSGLLGGTVAGTVDDAALDGFLEARDLFVSNSPVGDVDGSLRLAGSALEIIDLQARRGEGVAQGEGRFRIGQQAIAGADYTFGVRLDGYPMEVNLPRLGVPLVVAGETTGELDVSGAYGSPPAGEVSLQGTNVRLNDLGDLRADVRLHLDPDVWIAEQFELTGPRGRLTASGTWNRTDDTVEANVDGVDIDASIASDLTGADLPIDGSLQLRARLTGAFGTPDAAATLRWTDAMANGVRLGSVASSAELRAGSVAIAAVGRSDPTAPAVPPPTPTAAGGNTVISLPTVPTAGWAATLSADLQAPRLATLRAAGESDLVLAMLAAQGYETTEELDVGGSLDVAGSGPLGAWIEWNGRATITDFSLSRPGLSFSLPDPLTLALDAGVLDVDLPRLLSASGSLEANASIDVAERRWLDARASGSLALEVLEVFTEEFVAGGSIDVAMQASGDVLGGEIAGTFVLQDVSLGHPKSPWGAESVSGTVRLINNSLDLVGVTGLAAGERFVADGLLPLASLAGDDSTDPARLDVTIGALPLAPLWERTGPLHELITGGQASVALSVEGRGTDWRTWDGRVDLRSLTVELNDLDLTMGLPTSLTLEDGRLDFIDPIALRGPGTALEVSGGFLLGPLRLDARLQGTANLDPLNTVTEGWGIAGHSTIDVHVSGDPPELSYDGTVAIEAGLVNAPILQPIENISAILTVENRLVSIDSFTGSLGGGRAPGDTNISGDGEVQLVRSVPQRFVLNATVDGAEIRLQPGVRLTASADLVHEGTFERSELSGTMNVTEAEYTKRWESEAELLALSDSEVVGVDHDLARSVILDIDVLAPGDLRIVNNMADVELNADLQVRGTAAEPVLLGSTTVLDGSVTLRDQRYQFLRGSIDFQNPLRTEPNFDIAVETSVRQYLVTVNASGSPSRGDLQASFASSPPLSDLQLIQLLTVGDAPQETLPTDDETLGAVGAQATSFLTSQYLSHVERGAQRVFGLDRFRLEPAVVNGSGDPTARVTIGQQVTPDLWVSWTTKLGTTDEQLVTIEYQLTRGIRITATREDDGSIGVDFRFDHRFR